jgi:protease PrsW
MATFALQQSHPHHHHGWWWKTLTLGLALWIVTVVVTALTQNTNLIPTVILLGSFLVPFTVVMFAVERVTGSISTLQLILAFFIGGICGVLGASLLEANLHTSLLLYVTVGFIEEFVKGAILVILAWRTIPKTAVQGALMGAVVGAGFAAFESAGYAFNAALGTGGINLVALLQTEVLRAVLSPVGHVLWTAILGAVIFGVARHHPRFRWSFLILAAYVAVALLHGLWDSMTDISAFVALLVTGGVAEELRYGFLPANVAASASTLATLLYVIGLALVAAIGVVTLILILRHYRRADRRLGLDEQTPVAATNVPAEEEQENHP